MSEKSHHYAIHLTWTGNLGTGTTTYDGYSRNHIISGEGKTSIEASSDPAFRGDTTRWNPEELLVASVAACHKLWYLHLCSDAGVNVIDYQDEATGVMIENNNGSGQFASITLAPRVLISAASDAFHARALHEKVGDLCYVARSVNFPIHHAPVIGTQKSPVV